MNSFSTKLIQNKILSYFVDILSHAKCKLSCEDLKYSSHLKERSLIDASRIGQLLCGLE